MAHINLTPKQEKFAQRYIESGCASTAYRDAYDAENMKDNVIHVKACELLGSGKVTVRLQQLRERAQKRHDMTVDDITKMLKEDRQLAREIGQPSAAVSAAMGMAKLHGLVQDKTKLVGGGDEDAAPVINLTITRTVKQIGP